MGRSKKVNRSLLPVVLLLVGLLLISGCPEKENKPRPQGEPRKKIALLLAEEERNSNRVIRRQLEERARKENIELKVLVAEGAAVKQREQARGLIQEGVQAVICEPVDDASGREIGRELAEKNIKVVYLNQLPPEAAGDAYIAPDYSRAGELVTEYVLTVRRASGTGKTWPVLVVSGDNRVEKEMVSSIESRLTGAAPAVKVLKTIKVVAGEEENAAREIISLAAGKEAPAVVISTGSRATETVLKALNAAGMAERMLTVGFGAGLSASQALVSGGHEAEVDPWPEQLAMHAFDAALGLVRTGHWQYDTRLANGKFSIPARFVPVRLIDRDNTYILVQRWGNDLTREKKKEEKGESRQEGKGEGSSEGKGGSKSEDPGEGKSEEKGGGKEGGKKKSIVRISTTEGKTVEVQVEGEIKKIETIPLESGQR